MSHVTAAERTESQKLLVEIEKALHDRDRAHRRACVLRKVLTQARLGRSREVLEALLFEEGETGDPSDLLGPRR